MINKKTLTEVTGLIISLGAIVFAFLVIHSKLRHYSYHEILQSLHSIPAPRIWLAIGFTLVSYYLMTFYDWLALGYVGRTVKHSQMWFLSFISYAFSNNIGHPLVTGAVRYRLYSAWELGAFEIAKVVAFCSLSLWLGFTFLTGLVFAISPLPVPPAFHLSPLPQRLMGIAFLAGVTAYLFAINRQPRELRFRKLKVEVPARNSRYRQLLISSLDWTLAGSVLFVLLPAGHQIHYFSFLSYFLMAQFIGIISQVPGGLGVFESVMLIFLGRTMPTSVIIGSLLAFRMIYYIVPLGLATVLFAILEFLKQKKHFFNTWRIYDKILGPLAPHIFAVITFLGGIIMLFSGATPALRQRLLALQEFIPVPVIEVSHFFGSIIGIMLLFLAGGLYRRLKSAYFMTMIAMAGGIIVSLLKGFDYEEAFILSLMMLALVPSYGQFYRSASLLDRPLSLNWVLSILLAVASTLWLGFFSFKHMQYSSDMWWQFSLHGDASRFLRMIVGMAVVILVFSLMRLFRHFRPRTEIPPDPETISGILNYSSQASANLARLGDKRFFLNEQKTAFIMYAVSGKSWITMGDPVGKPEDAKELAWQFLEYADRHGGKAVFYEVRKTSIDNYLDMGLTLLKIGESAKVGLADYDLESPENKRRRRTIRTVEAEGCSFNILASEELAAILPQLRSVSDAWLKEKHFREKGFSLGFFSENYIRQFPCGVVHKNDQIIAFANLWTTNNKQELSIDLMRYLPGTENNVMEYLFIELFLWGKENGYKWFDLGMAPLSGLRDGKLAPLWHKLGSIIYEYGNNLYRLQGLRQYKDKFNPEWEPIYIALKGNLSLPETLLNLNTLINSGFRKSSG